MSQKSQPVPRISDTEFADEFYRDIQIGLDKVPVAVFLCGKGLPRSRKRRIADIRSFLKVRLEREFRGCSVKLGEHKALMRAYGRAAGKPAFNLADYEFKLAQKIDLLVIFPCSSGSLAELGMFCLEEEIARKMTVFLRKEYRRTGSYVVEGPVKAALRRKSTVHVVDYANKNLILERVRIEILRIRANKGAKKLLGREE